ncbi:hypothetical protein WJX72_011572 [[Myrmecia] bisecta]|uniref:FAS1 domain-containing protein n=1 Tax=[Myrmecia] bisecta TaxID=41462 RepID=A0AAW1PGZ6_9CHLO
MALLITASGSHGVAARSVLQAPGPTNHLSTLLDLLQQNAAKYSMLAQIANNTGLQNTLTYPHNFTFFAPSDAALTAYFTGLAGQLNVPDLVPVNGTWSTSVFKRYGAGVATVIQNGLVLGTYDVYNNGSIYTIPDPVHPASQTTNLPAWGTFPSFNLNGVNVVVHAEAVQPDGKPLNITAGPTFGSGLFLTNKTAFGAATLYASGYRSASGGRAGPTSSFAPNAQPMLA